MIVPARGAAHLPGMNLRISMTSRPDQHSKLRWGILGCARVARQVMGPGIRQSRNGVILAIASRKPEKAQKFAATFGIERAYGCYEEVLDDPDVQAVYIPLPNTLHREWTIKAAAAGKHVLCEKPLACDSRQAAEMVEACSTHGVLLMEGFDHRFHPQNLQIKRLIDSGRIGKVLRMTAVHSADRPSPGDIRLSQELFGGILMDKGCYCVNTARFIFGSEPVAVYAKAEFGAESGVDERMTATLEFADGGVAQFDCSFALSAGLYRQSYEVFAQGGHIYVPNGFSQVETYRHGTIVDTSWFVGNDTAVDATLEKIGCEGVHLWQLGAEFFADRVLNDEPLRFPAENGLANMRVIDAIFESARQGRPIEVTA